MSDTAEDPQPAALPLTPVDVVTKGPPPWLPLATLAVVPLTLVVAIINGSDRGLLQTAAPWALGFFAMSVFVTTWVTPSSDRAFAYVVLAGLVAAVVAPGSLVLLDQWAGDESSPPVDGAAAPNDLSANNAGRSLINLRLDGFDGSGMNFDGADLRGTSAVRAVFTGASFAGAVLRDANLRDARLDHACFRGSDLRGAVLEGAVIAGSDFGGAIIDGAVTATIDTAIVLDPSPCDR